MRRDKVGASFSGIYKLVVQSKVKRAQRHMRIKDMAKKTRVATTSEEEDKTNTGMHYLLLEESLHNNRNCTSAPFSEFITLGFNAILRG